MNVADDPRFRSLRPLGRGGTAEVLRAYVVDREIDAALKFPLAIATAPAVDFATLADREYHLIGDLTFPGLVRLLEPPHHSPNYLLLEFCAGPTLDKLGRVADISKALELISAVAVNLEYLHAHGIIHGDLKPQNIFLPSDWRSYNHGQFFFVKISDFSLGRFSDEPEATRAGLGTVGFMAPETIASSRTSNRSDLFALGVIAYQLLSGHHPFMDEDTDPVRVNARIAEDSPEPIGQLCPGLDPAVAEIVHQLLAREESGRPGSAVAVCGILEKAGCRYPFRAALHPKWFLMKRAFWQQGIERWLRADSAVLERVRQLTDEDPTNLHLLLSTNYRLGRLVYAEGKFKFTQSPYWPSRMRRYALRRFASGSFEFKRNVVTAAVVWNAAEAQTFGVVRPETETRHDGSLVLLLPSLLRAATVRRLSRSYARRAEHADHFAYASRLWVQAGDLEGAERCAYQAAYQLRRDSRNQDALTILRHVIIYADMNDRGWEVRQLIMLAGDLHKENGEAEQSLICYRRIVDLYANHPPDKLLAETYKDLGDIHKIKQDFQAGLEALQRALEIYRELRDDLEISHSLNNIGNIYWLTGDVRQALTRYRMALRIQRRLAITADVASTLNNIGAIYGTTGRFSRGIRILRLSLGLKREIGHKGEIARTLNNLGYILHLSGHSAQAVALLDESLSINREIGSRKEVLFNLENLTAVMITAGKLGESLQYIGEGMQMSEELTDKPHLGIFCQSMASVLTRMGRYSEAVHYLEQGAQILEQIDDAALAVLVQIQRAEIKYQLGNSEAAFELALAGLSMATEKDNALSRVAALLLLTRLSSEEHFWREAEALVHELQLVRETRLLQFNRLEFLLRHERWYKATDGVDDLMRIANQFTDDLELPRIRILLAEILLKMDDHDSARVQLDLVRADQIDELAPEAMMTAILQGKIAASMGDFEGCFSKYQLGLRLCKQIAETIEDKIDRGRYQTKPDVVFLVGEIRRLGARLGQKQRAGSGPALKKS
ncbi:MAG: serine/threonine-protein kinase [Candidatus Zixiibacteriota bacterium]